MSALITSKQGAARLCAEILDTARVNPIVGVAMAAERATPVIDVDRLRRALAGEAAVHVIATGEATWELKRTLPAGLDVYGDALRVWQPGVRAGGGGHALLLLDDEADPQTHVDHAVAIVQNSARRESAAVVTEIECDRATLRLTDGTTVVVAQRDITRHDVPVPQVLRPAQALRVLVVADADADGPAKGTLLPFEPDPRRRLDEAYGHGALLLGRVTRVQGTGALVEVLPGVVGVVRPGRLAEHPVTHPSDVVAEGDLTPVRIVQINGEGIELSMRAVPDERVEAASLYPDGPPWLVPPPVATELPALDDPAEPRADPVSPARPALPEPLAELTELEYLEDLVQRAGDTHDRSRRLVDDTASMVARLRLEADRLRRDLEADLTELRDRVLRTVENERDQIQGSTLEALEAARNEVGRLRNLLDEAERDRAELERQLRAAGDVAARKDSALRTARADAQRHRARARRLENELEHFVPADKRLRAAIRQSWFRHTTRADREQYPWREPVIGPDFVGSLEMLEGVSRQRVIDVCAEVVSGRAAARAGLQVHPLRATHGGGSPQQTRADGARAYRASLQVRSAAARRLHYWELPDGGVELAKVGYHDDFTIR